MAPRRKCPTCGSRQWHKEPSSGLIACSEGHVLQNYRNETTEMTEMGPHAMKKRTLKTAKKKKEVGSNADPKLYHGARGRYHYFVCLQWLLRSQVATLVKLWALPQEFEVVCRDVWALHLELLRDPVPPEPFNYAQQEAQQDEDEGGSRGNEAKPTAERPNRDRPKAEGGEEGYDSDSSSDSDLNEREMQKLMEENSDLSESDEDEQEKDASHDPQDADDAKLKGGRRKKKDGTRSREWYRIYESPPSTIAIMIVACWVLRVPCLYRDFAMVIESYELPYLDPIRLLPPNMVQHLTKHSRQALSPHHTPSTTLMHKLASRLAKRLHSTFAVYIPEANAPSILWRVVRAMGGTPTLYGLTKRIASVLSLPLTLHSSLAPGLRKKGKYDPNAHQMDNVPVEVSLMASCIIVLKMVYGLDGMERLPRDTGDPACAMPQFGAYLRLLREMNEQDAKDTERVFSSENAMRIEDLSEEVVDEYLGFCERALMNKQSGEKHDVLDAHFPVQSGSDPSGGGRVAEARPEALPATSKRGKGGLKPGEEYRIWNARDVLGTVPGEYSLVLGRAARWAGVSEEYLGAVVEKYERRIVRWQTRKPGKGHVMEDESVFGRGQCLSSIE